MTEPTDRIAELIKARRAVVAAERAEREQHYQALLAAYQQRLTAQFAPYLAQLDPALRDRTDVQFYAPFAPNDQYQNSTLRLIVNYGALPLNYCYGWNHKIKQWCLFFTEKGEFVAGNWQDHILDHLIEFMPALPVEIPAWLQGDELDDDGEPVRLHNFNDDDNFVWPHDCLDCNGTGNFHDGTDLDYEPCPYCCDGAAIVFDIDTGEPVEAVEPVGPLCGKTHGTGAVNASGTTLKGDCLDCNGTGNMHEGTNLDYMRCYRCGGTGTHKAHTVATFPEAEATMTTPASGN